MLTVMREYLAECQRQHVTPFDGFLNHLSTNTVDCDLDRTPVDAIRLFGVALSRAHQSGGGGRATSRRGQGGHRFPSASACGPRRGRVLDGSGTASPLLQRSKAGVAATTVSSFLKSARTSPSTLLEDIKGAADGGRLVCLRLRCGRMPATAAVAASGAPPSMAKSASVRQSGGRCAITLPSHRSVLRVLLDGLRCAVEGSRDCLGHFQLSGFPLDEMGDEAVGLLRALSRCRALRTLNLSGSSLNPELLSAFMTCTLLDMQPPQHPPPPPHQAAHGSTAQPGMPPRALPPSGSFPTLVEADLHSCGLTDKCGRALQFLISCSRERVELSRWQQSLRGGGADSRPLRGGDGKRSTAVNGQPYTSLPTARALERLDLSDNALGDAALMGIARAIQEDSALRTLNFSQNRVSSEGLHRFVESGVLESSSLDVVDFNRNPCAYPDENSSSGGGIRGPSSVPPILLPQPRFHQCIAAGLGQLLLLRVRTEDLPASRQARRSPGRLSLQTGSAVMEKDPTASGPDAVPSSAAPPAQQREIWRGETPPHVPSPSLAAPPVAPPANPAVAVITAHADAHGATLEGGRDRPADPAQPHSGPVNTQVYPVGETHAPAPPAGGGVQFYPLPPSTYILPVYQPFPAPGVPHMSPHCCHCCHCGDTSSSASGQHADLWQRHHPHPHSHPHARSRREQTSLDRPLPAGLTGGSQSASGRSRGLHDESSINVLSALTTPEDRSFAWDGTSGEAAGPSSTSRRRRAHRRQALAPRGGGQRASAAPDAPSPIPSEDEETSGAGAAAPPERARLTRTPPGAKSGSRKGRGGRGAGAFDPVLAGQEVLEEGEDGERDGVTSAPAALASTRSEQPLPAGTPLTAALTVADSQAKLSEQETCATQLAASVAKEVQSSLQTHLQQQLSLVERMVHEFDNYELELTEKLEKHQQQSTSRLDILRKELVTRLEKLSAEQRAAADAAAAEREAHANEVREKEAAAALAEETGARPEAEMEAKLVDLMRFLMAQIQSRVERASNKDDAQAKEEDLQTERADAQQRKVGELLFTTATQRDDAGRRQALISAANTQLRSLGW